MTRRGGLHERQHLLIDTNILLLLVVGTADVRQIARFKRTRQFDRNHYHFLLRFLETFDSIATTPHILTETSNLLGHAEADRRSTFRRVLSRFIDRADEKVTGSRLVTEQPSYARLGLTDAAIVDAASDRHIVLSDDLDLVAQVNAKPGGWAISFYLLYEDSIG